MRRYIVERNLLEENIEIVKRAAGEALIYGVLKANGYGLGLELMAGTLAARGVDRFCVTEAADAERLADMELPIREILLLRPMTDRGEIERLLDIPAVTFCVGSAEDAARLAGAGVRRGIRPRAHVKIDTGLGRYGLPWDRPMLVRYLYESFPAVEFTGIYTHFACAWKKGSVRRQFGRFCRVLRALEAAGIEPGIRHCSSSPALVLRPEMNMDAVRIGSAFLGRVCGGERLGLKSVGCCEARIDAVRSVSPGQTVGYGSVFRAPRDMRVAVANVGAVHGLRAGGSRGRQSFTAALRQVLHAAAGLFRRGGGLCGEVNGSAAPVVGSVCAECVILDVSDCACRVGDTVRFSVNPLYMRGMECVWVGEEPPVLTELLAPEPVRPVA